MIGEVKDSCEYLWRKIAHGIALPGNTGPPAKGRRRWTCFGGGLRSKGIWWVCAWQKEIDDVGFIRRPSGWLSFFPSQRSQYQSIDLLRFAGFASYSSF